MVTRRRDSSSLSFQEKSLWLMLVALAVAAAFYSATAWRSHAYLAGAGATRAIDVMPQQIALFGVAIAILVILSIVGHIVIAIADRRTDTDERDRLIALKGARVASYVLATGVFCALCTALATEGNLLFTHVLLGFWVLAQLVEIASQLVMYRRGA